MFAVPADGSIRAKSAAEPNKSRLPMQHILGLSRRF